MKPWLQEQTFESTCSSIQLVATPATPLNKSMLSIVDQFQLGKLNFRATLPHFFHAPCINLFQSLGLGILAQARDDYHHAKRLGGLCEESQHDFEELKLSCIQLHQLHLRGVLSCSF